MSSEIKAYERQQKTGKQEHITHTRDGDKIALDVNVASGSLQAGGSIVSENFDRFDVTALTADGCPTVVEYRLEGALVATVTITYDVNGNLESVVKS